MESTTTSLNEKKRDLFENQPIIKAIVNLAIPSIIGQLILVFYNMVDTFFIGIAAKNMADQALGNALIAGVTISMPVYMILSAISNLFGIGAASVISRSLGKNNVKRAKNSSQFAFYSTLLVTVIYCLLVFFFSAPLASLLSGGNSPEAAMFAERYILWSVVIFGIPTAVNTLFSHLLRAQGKAVHASIGIALGGILNCALDPLFMFVIMPANPVAGVAIATGISNTIALLYYIFLMRVQKKDMIISIKFTKEMFKEEVPNEVIRVGIPACLMTLLENVSYMILDALVGSVIVDKLASDAALAGIGVAKKINMVAHSVVRGMTQGVLPLIGYNKSSGNRKRMARIVYVSGAISLTIAAICMAFNYTLAPNLAQIFVHEELSIARSSEFLMILSIGAPFSAAAYTIISFFQAVGKPGRSLVLALMRKGILDIPMMFIFFSIAKATHTNFGPELIIWATPIADVICCVTAIILFSHYAKSSVYQRKQEEKALQLAHQVN